MGGNWFGIGIMVDIRTAISPKIYALAIEVIISANVTKTNSFRFTGPISFKPIIRTAIYNDISNFLIRGVSSSRKVASLKFIHSY